MHPSFCQVGHAFFMLAFFLLAVFLLAFSLLAFFLLLIVLLAFSNSWNAWQSGLRQVPKHAAMYTADPVVYCAVQGIVKSYNKKHKWFLIEYEDGDRSAFHLHAVALQERAPSVL